MVRKAFTPTLLAALASGAVIQASTEAPAAPAAAPAVVPAAADASVETVVTTEGAPAAAAADAPAAAAAATAPSVALDVTTFLQGQVAAKDAALLEANVALSGLKAKVADYEASVAGLKEIAAASISNMRIALGGSKVDLSAASATEILAQHAAAKKDFETKFVSGGVAAVDAAQDTNAAETNGVSAVELARLDALG